MTTSIEERIEKPVHETILQADAIVVVSKETRISAGEYLRNIKYMQSEVENTFDPIIEKAHLTHKEACQQKKKYFEPLVEAEKILKGKVIEWEVKQEKAALEEQARLIKEKGVDAPRVVADSIKVAGQSFREVWTAEVVDFPAFVKSVAEGKSPISLLQFNQSAGNKAATAIKDSMAYDGLRFKSEKKMTASGGL
jgi:hypothetical protein